MTKRKKVRTSGEGIRPPKPTKNPRQGDSDGGPQSSELDGSHHPEEPEGRSGRASSAEQSREELRQAVSSSPDEEIGASSRLLGQPEKEAAPFLPSQSSVERFVPQFAKPRKTVARKAETREEDPSNGAVSPETLPEPGAQQAGRQLLEESPGLALQEVRELGDQEQADDTHPEQSSWNLVRPVSSSWDPQPMVSPEGGTAPSASEGASQYPLLEQGTNRGGGNLENSRPETERAGVAGNHGLKGHLLRSDASGKETNRGVPQEGDTQGGAGADLPGGPWEEGDGVPASAPTLIPAQGLGPATGCPEPGSLSQGPPNPRQTPSGTGWEAEQSRSNQGCFSLGAAVIADMSIDPPELEQRAPEVARPDGQTTTRSSASPGRKASDGGHSRETTGGRGAPRWGDEPPGNFPVGLTASLALTHRNREPSLGAGVSGHLAPETGPGVDQKQVPGPDQEATKLGSQSHEQVPEGLGLFLRTSVLPEHREATVDPSQETWACQGSATPAEPAGQPENPPDSADQAIWGGSSAVEFDFLPESQIRDALDAPDFEASLEQLFPAGSRLDPCCPGPHPHANRDPLPVAETQLRTHVEIKAYEACRMEDATDTVRGLVVELSNLNRLIMSTHRDLEAFKRLNYWKAKPAGKGPLPFPSKGAGSLPRGEQF
ncbi:break repair meiotic recombinase recruitment factor 1 [Cynocephalus volans]|uniref:break repair meiotic recombinase recruitment factor 1 n=1 Tax=Cynocephalus volans TaxID=110931 RepID=UPI002FC658E0